MADNTELTQQVNALTAIINSIISASANITDLPLQSPLVYTSQIAVNGNEKITIQQLIDLLSIGTTIKTSVVSISTAYTVLVSDSTINCASGTFTVTLPTAVGNTGLMFNIKNSGTGIITIDGNGTETIDNELTQTITQWDNINLQSNGSNWIII